jgi:hypothetical protein
VNSPELERALTEEVGGRTLSLLHWGIGAGIGVMAGVSLLWQPGRDLAASFDPELSQWIMVFAAMTAGLHLLCLVMLKQVLAHMVGGRYLNYCVLRWALIEGIALYGLIVGLVGYGPRWTVGFFGLAAWLLWLERPIESDRRLFLSQFR